jgi:hypothetical protein
MHINHRDRKRHDATVVISKPVNWIRMPLQPCHQKEPQMFSICIYIKKHRYIKPNTGLVKLDVVFFLVSLGSETVSPLGT